MNKKTLMQLILLLIVLMITLIIFLKYFNEVKISEQSNIIDENISKKLNEKSNIIKNIEYFSKDDAGSTYSIKAEYGEINEEASDIILLKNVKAKINTLNSEPIFIESDFARYNSKNYDTNFYENTKVKYEDHKIDCRFLDLLFNINQAILYENIIYKSLNTKLKADRLEIDLITKNSKLSMQDRNEKIKIIYLN